MKLKLLVALVGLAVLGVPASAGAAGFTGVVVAKQPARGALVVALPGGRGLTVRAPLGGIRLGDRISLQGVRLADGTVRAGHVTPGRRIHLLRIRGVVVRQLARSTLLATGRSVIRIHRGHLRALASASDHGGLDAGEAATFMVRVDDDLLEQVSVTQSTQTGSVRIEGKVVSTSPFVVSVDGLPVTITVPAGATLPAGLAPGQRVELAVDVAPNNVFTLASLDQENEQQAQGDDDQGDDDQGVDESGDGDGGHDGGGHDGGDG